MRLDSKALAWSAGGVTLAALGACAVFVLAWPALAERLYGLVMHLDMTGRLQPVTTGTWAIGVVGAAVATAAIAWATAAVYNRLTGRAAPG